MRRLLILAALLVLLGLTLQTRYVRLALNDRVGTNQIGLRLSLPAREGLCQFSSDVYGDRSWLSWTVTTCPKSVYVFVLAGRRDDLFVAAGAWEWR